MAKQRSQKWAFLKALIITLIVFNIGIYMGYKLESYRIDKINDWFLNSDIQLLDQKIQEEALDMMDLNCELLVQENINFGDQIYQEALAIDRYEKANRINQDIIFQHKRYDLLRTLFWINSIKIKEKCNSTYHNVVYFYQYNDPTIELKSKQKFFSNLLAQLKEEKGSDIMLIPIAADNNLSAIDILIDKYEIEELPTILIDESIKITEVENIEDVEKHIS